MLLQLKLRHSFNKKKEEGEDGRVQKKSDRKINKEKREEATNKGKIFFSQLALSTAFGSGDKTPSINKLICFSRIVVESDLKRSKNP